MGPFPGVSKKYVLLFVDHFTKWVEIYVTKDMKAKTVADCFVSFVCKHGAPEKLLTDQGRDYESRFFQEVLELLDVHKARTTAYHPQCDGLSE